MTTTFRFDGKTVEVDSIDAAVKVWNYYRDFETGGGVSEIGNGGTVRRGTSPRGKVLARISYNGRVWAPDGHPLSDYYASKY